MLEGMAAGLHGWCALEDGRSKRLLGGIPDGARVPTEVATLERRAFQDLLNWLEMDIKKLHF